MLSFMPFKTFSKLSRYLNSQCTQLGRFIKKKKIANFRQNELEQNEIRSSYIPCQNQVIFNRIYVHCIKFAFFHVHLVRLRTDALYLHEL